MLTCGNPERYKHPWIKLNAGFHMYKHRGESYFFSATRTHKICIGDGIYQTSWRLRKISKLGEIRGNFESNLFCKFPDVEKYYYKEYK